MRAAVLTILIVVAADYHAEAASADQPAAVASSATESNCRFCSHNLWQGSRAVGVHYAHKHPQVYGSYRWQPYNYRLYFDYPWQQKPHALPGCCLRPMGRVVEQIPAPAAERHTMPGPSAHNR